MAFHIVTDKCFLACEKVTSVTLQELAPDKPLPKAKKKLPKGFSKAKTKTKPVKEIPKEYTLIITYYPIALGQNNYNGEPNEFTLDITVYGKEAANKLYAEIIKEVQEQHPNDGYLDKLVNELLARDEFAIDEPEEIER